MSAAGEGAPWYETGETHVRTLAIDAEGRVLAGTDPGGLVFRIETDAGGAARGFVLYQSSKRELTALAVGRDGSVYAAGSGDRSAGPTSAASAQSGPTASPGAQGGEARPPSGPQASGVAAQPRGGGEVVRLTPDGAPETIWESPSAVIYALGFDPDGALLLGTGGLGRLYRVESESRYWLERTLPSDQVTALASGADGRTFVATSNVGKIHAIGPGPAASGELLSAPFDAGGFARWGALEVVGQGARASLRTGNTRRPGRTWCPWSAVGAEQGARPTVPGARYAQWRLELADADAEATEVRQYFQPANRAPTITDLELTPPNFRFPAQNRLVAPVVTRTLPPLGGPPPQRAGGGGAPQTLTQAAGWTGVRWRAEDPNDDELTASVALRGEGGDAWLELASELSGEHYGFDSTGFADGWYTLRVSVSDAPSNPSGEAAETSRESKPFRIDNSAPTIEGLSAVVEGGALRVRLEARDAGSKLAEAAVSFDGGPWLPISPTGLLFDRRELAFDALFQEDTGVILVSVRVRDARDNQTVAQVRVRR